jgi:hypothetical protein
VGDTAGVRGTSYMETAASGMPTASHTETAASTPSGMPTASHMETAASTASGMSAASSAVSAASVRRSRCNVRKTESPDGHAGEKCERLFGQTETR